MRARPRNEAQMGVLIGFLWFLIIVTMILLTAIILLQEGKGGGLAEAFGGVGAETFGVKATGINRLTAILGGVFLFLVILVNLCLRWRGEEAVLEDSPVIESLTAPPEEAGEGGGDG